MSDINQSCMIIHQQLEVFLQDCFASHLQYWLHAICLIRHGQHCGLAHFKQLQGDGKSAVNNVSLMISGTKSSSSFKLYPYCRGSIEMSLIKRK